MHDIQVIEEETVWTCKRSSDQFWIKLVVESSWFFN